MSAESPALAVPPPTRARHRRVVRMPWWLQVVLVYAGARGLTTVMLLLLASVQGASPWTGAHPGYFDYASIWDGRWYDLVLTQGYPPSLPLGENGQVMQNAWAFLPGYPWLVGAVMFLTRLWWAPAAVLVSLAFGLGAALLFHRMLRERFGEGTTLFAVVIFCIGPVSPLFQLAYAESMYIFLLMAVLLLLIRRRYLALMPVVAVMAFVRPSGLAIALMLGLHVLYRWVVRRRERFAPREIVASVTATVVALAAGLAWPAIAAAVTGSLTAYTDTELSWRVGYIGEGHLVPFTAWFQGAYWWFDLMLRLPAWLGYLTLVLIVVAFALLLFVPAVRRLGVDIRLWLASYAVYLLAVFFPQSSTFRILMPMFPLAAPLAVPRSRGYRVLIVLVMLGMQLGWLLICWGIDGADWSPP